MKYKHTRCPGFFSGLIDFCTAGIFFLLYMPLGGLQDELEEILGHKTMPYWKAYEAAHAFFDYLFKEKGARRIYAYTEDYNFPSQRLCEKLGIRREGLFLEFVSFVNNPDGSPRYENTVQYAILRKEWH